MRSARRCGDAFVHQCAAKIIGAGMEAFLREAAGLVLPCGLNVPDPRVQHQMGDGIHAQYVFASDVRADAGISDFFTMGASADMKLSGTNSVIPPVSI